MDARRNCAQALGSVINGIHRRHHGKEDLRRADIARGFVASDMLLAGLKCEPICRTSFSVVRHTNEPTGEMTLELIPSGHVRRMRPAEPQWNTKPLGAANCDVSA